MVHYADCSLEVLLAEYNALRREIELLIEHQKDTMNFLILVFVAMIGLFGYIKDKPSLQPFSYAFLFFPFIFCSLILLYADKTMRILRAANYIHNCLRKRICDVCEDERLLRWEKYKRHEDSFSKDSALWLDRARWFIFAFSILVSIVLFFLSYGDGNIRSDRIALFFIYLDLIVALTIGILIIPQLEETKPIKDRRVNLNDC